MKTWIAAIFSSLLVTTAWSQPLSSLVIFGDSLSDTGNSYEYSKHHIPSGAEYYRGRFCNGPIWVDQIKATLFPSISSHPILNYAFGGAGVLKAQPHAFTLSQEIDGYLLSHQSHIDAGSVLMLWIGANDYLLNPNAKESEIHAVIDALETNVQRLIDHGARHVMIFALPDLGSSPFARELDEMVQLSAITGLHNQLLKDRVTELQTRYPKVDWAYVDINALFLDLIAHPERYGLTDVKEKCLHMQPRPDDLPVQMQTDDHGQCLGYLFFDQLHPTTAVHQLLANAVAQAFISNHD